MDLPAMQSLAREKATAYKLYPAVVCALVEHESSWDPMEIKFERGWQAKLAANPDLVILPHPPPPDRDTEIAQRSFSWGLMQVLGQTARENGFKDRWLTELVKPEIGLEFGCKILAGKIRIASGDIRRGLLFYNGGSVPTYPDVVMGLMPKYQ